MNEIPRKKVDERKFTLLGRPQPKERPRLFRGHAYTPKKTLDYEQRLRIAYTDVHGDKSAFTGDVAVTVYIYVKNRVHGDCDNFLKIVLDGLNSVAYVDDKQVKELHGYLTVDKTEPERMDVAIRPLNGGDAK